MKLIKCHVSGFGNLIEVDYDFHDNLNTFLRKNGEGKSTLASFLKAMLYGMDMQKTNGKFTDRKHYCPLMGGKYGGSLTIEYKGKQYTIAKKFDEKSKTKDTLQITDSLGNNVTAIDGKAIDKDTVLGNLFVGIDEEAFSRCNYIYSNDLDFKINDSIKMKLNNLILDSSKENSYSEIMANVDSDLKSNRSSNKSFGSTYEDKIHLCNTDIEEKKTLIHQIEDSKPELEESYQKYNEAMNQLNVIHGQREVLNQKKIEKDNWNTLDSLQKKLDLNQLTLQSLLENYPKGMVSKEDLDQLEMRKGESISLQKDLNRFRMTEDDKEFIEKYQNRYQGQVITEGFYEELTQEYQDIQALSNTKDSYQKPDSERLDILERRFTVNDLLPLERVQEDYVAYQYDKDKLDSLSSAMKDTPKQIYPTNVDMESANAKVKAYDAKKAELDQLTKSYSEPSGFVYVLLVIFTLGIYYFIANKKKKEFHQKKDALTREMDALGKELDALFSKFGIVGTDYSLRLHQLITLATAQHTDNRTQEMDTLSQSVTEKGFSLRQYFFKFGYRDNEITNSYFSYCKDFHEYQTLKEKKDEYENQLNELEKKVSDKYDTLNQKLNPFFGSEMSISDKLLAMKKDISLKKAYDEKAESLSVTQSKKKENLKQIQDILNPYSIPLDEDFEKQYSQIQQDYRSFDSINSTMDSEKDTIEKFKSEKKLTVREEIDVDAELAKLDEKEGVLKATADSYNDKIKNMELENDKEDDYKADIEHDQELILSYQHELEVMKKTREFIEKAEQNLEAKYLKPVKEKFDHYSDLIMKEIGEKTTMNFDYNITREVGGQTIGCEYLSDGEKTILMLALRFAVIDNLYKDNDTFVIMDDPLVYLDSENLVKAKRVIQELAKEKQIIYFSCHNSRNI